MEIRFNNTKKLKLAYQNKRFSDDAQNRTNSGAPKSVRAQNFTFVYVATEKINN